MLSHDSYHVDPNQPMVPSRQADFLSHDQQTTEQPTPLNRAEVLDRLDVLNDTAAAAAA
jgi:hypothetical protein